MKNILLAILGLAGVALVLGLLTWVGIWDNLSALGMGIKPEVYKAFAGMCTVENPKDLPERVRGVERAADFSASQGAHPLVALTTSGDFYESASSLPRGWNPDAISDTQLVLCITKERLDLPAPPFPICYHNVDRAAGRRVGLFAARSGEKLWTGDFYHYYEPCVGNTVDETPLSNIISEIQSNIAEGNIKP
jgi:hypothetical protein